MHSFVLWHATKRAMDKTAQRNKKGHGQDSTTQQNRPAASYFVNKLNWKSIHFELPAATGRNPSILPINLIETGYFWSSQLPLGWNPPRTPQEHSQGPDRNTGWIGAQQMQEKNSTLWFFPPRNDGAKRNMFAQASTSEAHLCSKKLEEKFSTLWFTLWFWEVIFCKS